MSEKEEKKSKKQLKQERRDSRRERKEKENEASKAKVAEALEEESSEEEGPKVTRVGYVEMKAKTWKAVYCLLIGGSFYWSKSSTDSEPKGHIDLKGHRLVEDMKGMKKKYVFAIQSEEGENLFVGAVSSETELNNWKHDIQEALSLEPALAPAIAATKKRKQSVMSRAKKNMASGAATSMLGKRVMKTIINEETTQLINALKKIVKKESGSAKKAEELEKNIIKIAVKGYLLIENKILTADDFLVADKPLRAAFEMMVKVFNGKSRVKRERILEAIEKIVADLKKAEEIVTNLLAPHLQSKNMLRVSSTFAIIADSNFLDHAFSDPELEDDLETLVDAMEYYTQFHYHAS